MHIENIIFTLVLIVLITLFYVNFKRIIDNIKLGRSVNRFDRPLNRWKNMIRVALGQSKMVRRPVAGLLHVII